MKDILNLNCTDAVIMRHVLDRIYATNPRIKIGQFISSPVAHVWKGKVVNASKTKVPYTYSLDFQVPHIEQPFKVVQAHSMKIFFKELESMEWGSFSSTWLYPYEVTMPHRELLRNHRAGDVIHAMDEFYDCSEFTLTDKVLQDHSYINFRFAVSD